MSVSPDRKLVTYFAADPYDPRGEGVVLGRGDPGDPDSLASSAFASVDIRNAAFGDAIVANIDRASKGQKVTRETAAQVLGEALRLAEIDKQIKIRTAKSEDIDALRPTFEKWIRDRHTGEVLAEEVAELEEEIRSSIEGSGQREYFIAEDGEGKPVGIMGMQSPPCSALMHFTFSDRPIETINAYVAESERSGGTGRALAKHIEDLAIQQGYTELLVNSGPRYKDTGWPFWTKLYGEPAGTAIGFYGPGGDALVWRKSLTEEK